MNSTKAKKLTISKAPVKRLYAQNDTAAPRPSTTGMLVAPRNVVSRLLSSRPGASSSLQVHPESLGMQSAAANKYAVSGPDPGAKHEGSGEGSAALAAPLSSGLLEKLPDGVRKNMRRPSLASMLMLGSTPTTTTSTTSKLPSTCEEGEGKITDAEHVQHVIGKRSNINIGARRPSISLGGLLGRSNPAPTTASVAPAPRVYESLFDKLCAEEDGRSSPSAMQRGSHAQRKASLQHSDNAIPVVRKSSLVNDNLAMRKSSLVNDNPAARKSSLVLEPHGMRFGERSHSVSAFDGTFSQSSRPAETALTNIGDEDSEGEWPPPN